MKARIVSIGINFKNYGEKRRAVVNFNVAFRDDQARLNSGQGRGMAPGTRS